MSSTSSSSSLKASNNNTAEHSAFVNTMSTENEPQSPLPSDKHRFELELEFLQALASPAYWHFLATSPTEQGDGLLFADPSFLQYLQYLYDTWSQPQYSRYLSYPHALYFVELVLLQSNSNSASTTASTTDDNKTSSSSSSMLPQYHQLLLKEWTLPAFRNFCHQQQFLAWQKRHETLYGVGTRQAANTTGNEHGDKDNNVNN